MADEETTVVEELHGGEEMGYRIPMNLKVDVEEEGATLEGPPDEGREGTADEDPRDEGLKVTPAEGDFDITEETLFELGGGDLDALIDQEELGVDKNLPIDQKRVEVAKALGWDVAEGPIEGSESAEELKQKLTEMERQIALLTPGLTMVQNLEADPENTLRELAKHYGIELGPGPTKFGPKPEDIKVEIPRLDPGQNEDMPTYMARLVSAGLQSIMPQLMARAQTTPTPEQPVGRRPSADPRVVKAIQYLDKYHPDWPQYQEKMIDTLKVNPSLVTDPEALYVKVSGRKTGRAAAKAKKLTLKKRSTGERGGRKPIRTVPKKRLDPSKDGDFREAWNRAKRQAEKRG